MVNPGHRAGYFSAVRRPWRVGRGLLRGLLVPDRLACLWGWCVGGLMAAFVLRGQAASARLDVLAARSPLFERAYVFFELYEPHTSLWLLLLLAATLVSVTALLIERLAGPRDTGGLEGPVIRKTRRAGAFLVVLGALLVLFAIGMERRLSISGEMLVRAGEKTDVVRLPASLGVHRQSPLGFTLAVDSIDVDRIVAVAEDEKVVLVLDEPVVIRGRRLRLRDVRSSKERGFQLSITDLETMDAAIKTVEKGEVFEAFPAVHFVLIRHEKDLRGLGEAILLRQVGLELGDGEGTLLEGEEPFWVFREYPDFDRNRGKPHAVTFLGSELLDEAIVAVVRHPGLWPAVVGGAIFLLGLLTLLVRPYSLGSDV